MTVYYIVGAIITLCILKVIGDRIRGQHKTVCVAADNCTGCKKCLKHCRRNVLEAVKNGNGVHIAVKNPDRCSACGDCLRVCRFNALEIVERQTVKGV